MLKKFNSNFYFPVILYLIVLIFCLCFFMPIYAYENYSFSNSDEGETFILTSSNFCWPVPGYSKITSNFGYRIAPTTGASTYHGGIDIAAPAGSNLVAIFSGEITYIGFNGGGGYTVTIQNNEYSASYSHIDELFLVKVGDKVYKNSIIARVGPKNVYNAPNNKYKDSSGKPTNGATTGPHLHFSLKIDGKAVNPLDYY